MGIISRDDGGTEFSVVGAYSTPAYSYPGVFSISAFADISATPGLFGNSISAGGSAAGQTDGRTSFHGVFMILDDWTSNVYRRQSSHHLMDNQTSTVPLFTVLTCPEGQKTPYPGSLDYIKKPLVELMPPRTLIGLMESG